MRGYNQYDATSYNFVCLFYLGTNQRTSGVLHEIVHQPLLADSADSVREI